MPRRQSGGVKIGRGRTSVAIADRPGQSGFRRRVRTHEPMPAAPHGAWLRCGQPPAKKFGAQASGVRSITTAPSRARAAAPRLGDPAIGRWPMSASAPQGRAGGARPLSHPPGPALGRRLSFGPTLEFARSGSWVQVRGHPLEPSSVQSHIDVSGQLISNFINEIDDSGQGRVISHEEGEGRTVARPKGYGATADGIAGGRRRR